jgi:hypothetical protein
MTSCSVKLDPGLGEVAATFQINPRVGVAKTGDPNEYFQ